MVKMTDRWPIETMFVEANGLRFEVETCGEGDRLALCLHGFPEAAFSWRNQLPLLAELGYRVWAPNQRGYGRTTRPPKVYDYRTDLLVADVAGLIDVSDARSVTLIGHDWGAMVAWLFAADRIGSSRTHRSQSTRCSQLSYAASASLNPTSSGSARG
jgi:pimeloyl-ACP methyl ester carboxylesterase